MTVLRPSLPPVSWTTTRIVSRAPARWATGAWAAVLLRKLGTLAPRAIMLEFLRKARRVSMAGTPWAWIKFNQAEIPEDTTPGGTGRGRVGRPRRPRTRKTGNFGKTLFVSIVPGAGAWRRQHRLGGTVA